MADTPTISVDPEKTSVVLEYKHVRPLTACHWEPRSRFVFFGAEDSLVHRFDVAGQTVVSLAAHQTWVRSFGSSPDGDVLYSGGYDGRLVYWPAAAEAPEPLRVIDAHQGWVRAMAVSPNGESVATCGNDLLVKVWNAADGTLVKQFAGHKSHVYNLIFLRDGATLVSCDLKGTMIAWTLDSDAPRELLTVEALHKYDEGFRADIGGARSIALRSDGAQLALGGITNVTNAFAGVGEIAVALVNLAEPKLDRLLESKEKTQGTVWGVAHHPDGFWIGLSGGGGGGWLWFWKEDSNHEFFKLKLKSDGRGMSLSPDQTQLAVAHADSHLRTYALHAV
ncbi:MAG: WD40 repeat domain-containing protein [Planctomycetaceae bacterium]